MLRACLRALRVSADEARHVATIEVVVVDNASVIPYRRADLPGVDRVIRLDTHHSFAAACNAAVDVGPSDSILLLNNDVLLHEHAIVDMISLLSGGVAIVGTRLVFPDGTIQHAGVEMGSGGPRHRNYRVPSDLVPRTPTLEPAVTGAAMLIRTSAYAAAGGLDPEYAFGAEDIDLCWRIRQDGWQIMCTHGVDSLHFEAMTDGRREMDVASLERMHHIWGGRYAHDASG
jgi:GT2 family glycosyltransferase